jgi:hypothetical protein
MVRVTCEMEHLPPLPCAPSTHPIQHGSAGRNSIRGYARGSFLAHASNNDFEAEIELVSTPMTSDPGECCVLATRSSCETLHRRRGASQMRQVHENDSSEMTRPQWGRQMEGVGIGQRCSTLESIRTPDSYLKELCPTRFLQSLAILHIRWLLLTSTGS